MYPEEILELVDLGSRVVVEKGDSQLRLSVSEFRGEMYLALRWWYLNFDQDGYYPTKEGVTIPYTMGNVSELWNGLVALLSEGEVIQTLLDHGVNLKNEIPTSTESG